VTELLKKQETTLADLHQLLGHARTEKTAKVLERAGIEAGEKKQQPAGERSRKRAARGHGRHAAAAYEGAERVPVPHTLKAGDPCPHGCGGKVYPQRFMSLIHTCELNGANAFDYLTELQRHTEELKQNPSEWMPWNYRETLARLARPAAA
jgi:hypothetical protein